MPDSMRALGLLIDLFLKGRWSFGGLPVASQGQASPRKKPRGFVLSFSTFALAIFLVVFAQLQYSHLQTLQLDASDIHQISTPARVLRDIALDFNTLTGQTIAIDQNSGTAIITLSGKRPNVLSTEDNLLRYQTNLFRFGRDTNTSIFLDLNQTIADGKLWGRTNRGLQWREGTDNNRFRVFPPDINFNPISITINIYSELAYTSVAANVDLGILQLPPAAVYLTINYTDVNADHNITYQSYAVNIGGYNIHASYDVNGVTVVKRLEVGVSEDTSVDPEWFGTSISGAPTVPWTYSITYAMPNDANGTRAGYDINTTIRGSDMNIDTNTIWTYGG